MPQFLQSYEYIQEDVVPGTGKYLHQEDKEGNQLWRVIMFSSVADSFISKAKSKNGFVCRKFVYDIEGYKEGMK